MSHQSLELKQNEKLAKDSKSRYGALNGSVLHSHNGRDRKARNTISAVYEEGDNLSRRVSTILV